MRKHGRLVKTAARTQYTQGGWARAGGTNDAQVVLYRRYARRRRTEFGLGERRVLTKHGPQYVLEPNFLLIETRSNNAQRKTGEHRCVQRKFPTSLLRFYSKPTGALEVIDSLVLCG